VTYTSQTAPIIDVHCHYVPESYRKALTDAGLVRSDIFPLAPWEMEKHVEDMDFMNIGAAVMGVSSPDVHWGDSGKAKAIARDANEVAAEAVQAHPDRFGFWASLPVPDVDASLEEIEYAFDVLHADGVKFYSNSNGVYLGDPKLDPIFEELGRRGAVVTVHPTKPKCVPDNVLVGVPYPLFEFQFETTRAIANMMFNGTLKRNPGLKFLCPHMGATFPILGGRMEGIANLMVRLKIAGEGFVPPDFQVQFKNLYYDSAGGFNLPIQIPALMGISSPGKLLCGSDYPFTPAAVGKQMLEELRNTNLLTEEEKVGVMRTNALSLFPRFAKIQDGLTAKN
jgi:6-methylsalicylate decarboxylase